MNRDKIIERIKALSERTTARGCTEAEALVAAEMVARLCNEHGVSMTDVEVGEERCQVEYLTTGRKTMHEVQYCVGAIGALLDCKVWFRTTYGREKRIAFFGWPADTAMAKWLTETIKLSMDSELHAWGLRAARLGESTNRQASHSFLMGMACRVSERLHAIKAEQRSAAVSVTGRDLVVVKAAAVNAQFRDLGIKLRSNGGGTRIGDNGAYYAGKAAGDRVGLSRPIGGRESGPLMIGGAR
jgi:hypothetical protein